MMFKRYFIQRRIRNGAEIEDYMMTVTEKEEALMEAPIERKSISFIWYFMIVILLVLSGRVFFLDIIQRDYYSAVSRENRIRSVVIKAPRGNILDKFGKIIARNVPSLDAVIIPSYIPKDQQKKSQIIQTVASILEMDLGNVEAIITSQNEKSFDPVLLKENITQDQALLLSEKQNEIPGVIVDKTAIRSYEDGAIFSHVVGYDGKITREEMEKNKGYLMTDYIGKSGLEKKYEKELRGVYGAKQVEIDSLGNVKRNIGSINPQAGNNLILNIDDALQKRLYDSMAGILDKTETSTAAAVAIDPRNGGVLAMVSMPSYDNNMFAKGITNEEYKNLISDPNLPFLNRATSGEYPPGSTLKPAVAAGALSEGTITPSTIIDGLGGMLSIGNFHFRDWKAHAPSDVRTAIAESNDIFFYAIGGGYGNITGLGMNRMKKYENLFGFGSPLGIDLPSESSGLIPDEQWKLDKIKERWYVGDSYHSAIGQGFITATPLQLAAFTATLANSGTLYKPRIVNRIEKYDGQKEFINPEVIRKDFISPDVMKVVREGMLKTVEAGTAQTLKDLPVVVAGKTGTSQFGTEDKTHGWFISFAPYDNPTIAMVVLVEGGGEGHSSAVPITQDVYDWYFNRDNK